jgi:hypothetical protein
MRETVTFIHFLKHETSFSCTGSHSTISRAEVDPSEGSFWQEITA